MSSENERTMPRWDMHTTHKKLREALVEFDNAKRHLAAAETRMKEARAERELLESEMDDWMEHGDQNIAAFLCDDLDPMTVFVVRRNLQWGGIECDFVQLHC